MNIKNRIKNRLNRNISLTLLISFTSAVILVLCFFGTSWAWFNASLENASNTISTGSFDISLSLTRNDSLMLMANKTIDNVRHIQEIQEVGDYTLDISSINDINGYCILNISDDDNLLLSKTIKVDRNNKTSFVIHTNKHLYIEISNINWGYLDKYDELETDYYFGTYSIEFDEGISEYSILPDGYKEVSYLQGNGTQYIEDIIVNDEIIFSYKDYFDNENIAFEKGIYNSHTLLPCINDSNTEGIYDLTDSIFYPNMSENSFDVGEEVKHYKYLENEELDCVINKLEQMNYCFGRNNDSQLCQSNTQIIGYHFVCWQIGQYKLNGETIDEIEKLLKPVNGEVLKLSALFEKNTNYLDLYVDDEKIDSVEIQTLKDDINIDIPNKEGFDFLGYFDEDDNIVFDNTGSLINNPFELISNNETMNVFAKFIEKRSVEE